MIKKGRDPPSRLWAYAYQITLPEPDERFDGIQELLDEGHAEARSGERTWNAQLVQERQVMQILVVTDTRTRDHPIDRRIEAALSGLNATFTVTEPMAVSRD